MKRIHKLLLLLACAVLAGTAFLSCEIDSADDPEHPLYVTYTISGDEVSFSGPNELINDIKAWYKANSIAYDTQVNYTSGKAEEFAKTDSIALDKYNKTFMPKFNNFLSELRQKLSSGTYGTGVEVRMTLSTFAARMQGEQKTLKYEQFEFCYPETAE